MEVFVHMPASPIVVLPANKGVSPGHFSCTPCNSYPESCSEDVTCTTDFSERTFDDTTTATFADIEWHELSCIRHLTRGGSSLVYSARYHGRPVVVKTLRPQLRESDSAVSEFESELAILSQLNHANIVKLFGAGVQGTGVRFLVFEKLDGGTLSSRLGLDAVQRKGFGQFKKKKRMPYQETLECARSLAMAMQYLHSKAIPNSVVLHRDLKPDNIAFALDGTVKLLDFGLAKVLENADPSANEVYTMSGETGSFRYMAPEVAKGESYNHKADVYSFGIILWEMFAGKKSFTTLRSEEEYFDFVVDRCVRPPLKDEWPIALCSLISECWDTDLDKRPDFQQVIMRLDFLLSVETESMCGANNRFLRQRINRLIDRRPKLF